MNMNWNVGIINFLILLGLNVLCCGFMSEPIGNKLCTIIFDATLAFGVAYINKYLEGKSQLEAARFNDSWFVRELIVFAALIDSLLFLVVNGFYTVHALVPVILSTCIAFFILIVLNKVLYLITSHIKKEK